MQFRPTPLCLHLRDDDRRVEQAGLPGRSGALVLPRLEAPLQGAQTFRNSNKSSFLDLQSGARGPPQFLKKRSENAGASENLSGGFAAIPGIAPRVAPRIVGFVLIKS